MLGVLVLPNFSYAAMKSANYVIFENINHEFDGPIISGVSASVSGNSATVVWTTNAPSSSYVEYDTDSAFSASKEQGNSAQTKTSHSVEVSGLEYSTSYYYRVKSRRANGGLTTGSTGTFTTGSDPGTGQQQQQQSGGGGGILIIDKTDKVEPQITDLAAKEVAESSAKIEWTTDEESTSFVEYGVNGNRGSITGTWDSTESHSVELDRLLPGTTYLFRAISSDNWGNIGSSTNLTFTTLGESVLPPGATDEQVDEILKKNGFEGLSLAEASAKALELFKNLSGTVTANDLESTLEGHIDSVEELLKFIPAPILSGVPRIEIEDDKASFFWTTDKEANSLVAISPENDYSPEDDEPYAQIVGNADELTLEHRVDVFGLLPNSAYHYQLRSRASTGPTAYSPDFILKTNLESLKIISLVPQVIDDNTAVFKWATTKEADSQVEAIPFRGNVLSLEEAKTVKNNEKGIIHEMEVKDFKPGVFYSVNITSTDASGNVATESLDRFSTSEDDSPPKISQIKTNSTIFVDQGGKVQTVITWMTNEPATTRVFYQEGVHGGNSELKESTDPKFDYSKEHVVVITKFKPGAVYSFRVESFDSGDNRVVSKPHTFMTPKQKESIIQVIIRILEDTFGWVKKIV